MTSNASDVIPLSASALLVIGICCFLLYCVLGYNRHRQKSWKTALRTLLITAFSLALVSIVIFLIWGLSNI